MHPTITNRDAARDLSTLWRVLPGPASLARTSLANVEARLHLPVPDLAGARGVAAAALFREDDDDAEERALLAALHRLLSAPMENEMHNASTPPPLAPWHDHIGHTCPIPSDAFVRVDLGEGLPIAGAAEFFYWGVGAGPDGEGRIQRYAVLHPGSAS